MRLRHSRILDFEHQRSDGAATLPLDQVVTVNGGGTRSVSW
jgi:hypothetical protein